MSTLLRAPCHRHRFLTRRGTCSKVIAIRYVAKSRRGYLASWWRLSWPIRSLLLGIVAKFDSGSGDDITFERKGHELSCEARNEAAWEDQGASLSNAPSEFGSQLQLKSNGYVHPNNALERTVRHRGPRLAAARSSWPAAQLGR